jgi:hypothetical protein
MSEEEENLKRAPRRLIGCPQKKQEPSPFLPRRTFVVLSAFFPSLKIPNFGSIKWNTFVTVAYFYQGDQCFLCMILLQSKTFESGIYMLDRFALNRSYPTLIRSGA